MWVGRMDLISDLDHMLVSDIMRYWPSTVRVFLDRGMLCVGCPIGGFHTLSNAAYEHGLNLEELELEIDRAIRSEVLRA